MILKNPVATGQSLLVVYGPVPRTDRRPSCYPSPEVGCQRGAQVAVLVDTVSRGFCCFPRRRTDEGGQYREIGVVSVIVRPPDPSADAKSFHGISGIQGVCAGLLGPNTRLLALDRSLLRNTLDDADFTTSF